MRAAPEVLQPRSMAIARLPFHYAWVVVTVTFTAILVSAGVRAAPGVFIKPLEAEFGWDRAAVSFPIAVGLFTFGLGAPLAGSLVDRFGPRRLLVGGLALVALGLAPLLALTALWQMTLLWGIVVGIGSGGVANVLGATVAHRWFDARRGMVVGLFAAAASMGQLVFLPAIMGLTLAAGWRAALLMLLAATLAVLVPVLLLMRNRPEDVGLRPVGQVARTSVSVASAEAAARRTSLAEALRTRDYWLLAGSFFICGYTSTGLIGTHLIPHAVERGYSEVTAASGLALMGAMNVVGTLASGWLTDRFDPRRLLAAYYGFRALSLLALPAILDVPGLMLFAVVFGLDYIATVPPTTQLTAARFGRASLGTLLGWIFFAHMAGAGLAAYLGGFLRQALGDYTLVFLSAAGLGFVAVALSLRIRAPLARSATLTPA